MESLFFLPHHAFYAVRILSGIRPTGDDAHAHMTEPNCCQGCLILVDIYSGEKCYFAYECIHIFCSDCYPSRGPFCPECGQGKPTSHHGKKIRTVVLDKSLRVIGFDLDLWREVISECARLGLVKEKASFAYLREKLGKSLARGKGYEIISHLVNSSNESLRDFMSASHPCLYNNTNNKV